MYTFSLNELEEDKLIYSHPTFIYLNLVFATEIQDSSQSFEEINSLYSASVSNKK